MSRRDQKRDGGSSRPSSSQAAHRSSSAQHMFGGSLSSMLQLSSRDRWPRKRWSSRDMKPFYPGDGIRRPSSEKVLMSSVAIVRLSHSASAVHPGASWQGTSSPFGIDDACRGVSPAGLAVHLRVLRFRPDTRCWWAPMSRVVFLGGGIGTCAVMMLARVGHEVVVLERDPAPPPSPAEAWGRMGPARRQPIQNDPLLPCRFRRVADIELSGLTEASPSPG